MKTSVVLAIVVSLISVQGSSVNEDVFENDYVLDSDYRYSSADGRDAINDGKIEDELQGREILWDGRAALQCLSNVCAVCKEIYCFSVGYLAANNTFVVAFTKYNIPFHTETIKAIDWDQCIQLETVPKVVEACVRIENVKIEDGQACVDLTINSEFMARSFSNVCM